MLFNENETEGLKIAPHNHNRNYIIQNCRKISSNTEVKDALKKMKTRKAT